MLLVGQPMTSYSMQNTASTHASCSRGCGEELLAELLLDFAHHIAGYGWRQLQLQRKLVGRQQLCCPGPQLSQDEAAATAAAILATAVAAGCCRLLASLLRMLTVVLQSHHSDDAAEKPGQLIAFLCIWWGPLMANPCNVVNQAATVPAGAAPAGCLWLCSWVAFFVEGRGYRP